MRGAAGDEIVARMPEGPSNVEVAHHVHERGGEPAHPRRFGSGIEIGEAILLAIVAVATAWSGYQSALWDGRSAKLYGASSRLRLAATELETRGGQVQVYEGTTFNFWLRARLEGDARLARAYVNRFPIEYRPAFHAWLATHPFSNANAPAAPISMPQYRNALLERGARGNERASQVFERGVAARETGDKYVRTTVLLATVLFLIALSQRFALFGLRVALLCVALVLLGVALGSIATYPRI